MNNYPLSRKANVVVQELDGEVLIYDLNANKAYCLNKTSAIIWQLCDGNKSVTEISQALSQKLDSPTDENLVWLALDQFKKEKLIESQPELVSPFVGMNRREVIKKVGLASMIALPIVSSLIAPKAINAASGATPCTCPNGQLANATMCTNSPQCTAPGLMTCSGVTCNGGGNNCGILNGTCGAP